MSVKCIPAPDSSHTAGLTSQGDRKQYFFVKNTYSITEAQKDLPRIARQLNGAAAITRHDEAVAYLVSREHWESVLESMELMSDTSFRQHLARMADGKVRYINAKNFQE